MPDKEQRSEYSADSELKIEMIKGPEDEKEICVFSRVVLDCEAVVEGFKAIKQSLEMMKQDAREDKPQTPLGRKYRELYLMAYHESPRL